MSSHRLRSPKLAIEEADRYLSLPTRSSSRNDPSERAIRAANRAAPRHKTGLRAITNAVTQYLLEQTAPVDIEDIVSNVAALYTRRRVGDVLNVLHSVGYVTHWKSAISVSALGMGCVRPVIVRSTEKTPKKKKKKKKREKKKRKISTDDGSALAVPMLLDCPVGFIDPLDSIFIESAESATSTTPPPSPLKRRFLAAVGTETA